MSQLKQQQQAFAARIRRPDIQPLPEGVTDQRMKVYEELFFNNVKGFLDTGFPVLMEIMGEQRWLDIARDFFARHQCKTPYFLEISQEFLAYLENEFEPIDSDPVYFYELAHYEWLELYVDVEEADQQQTFDANADLASGKLVLAPVVQAFVYNYPVHQASSENRDLAEQQAALIVYRNRNFETKFIESNVFTIQLLSQLLTGQYATVKELLENLLQQAGMLNDNAYQAGLATIAQWQQAGLVLGAEV